MPFPGPVRMNIDRPTAGNSFAGGHMADSNPAFTVPHSFPVPRQGGVSDRLVRFYGTDSSNSVLFVRMYANYSCAQWTRG